MVLKACPRQGGGAANSAPQGGARLKISRKRRSNAIKKEESKKGLCYATVKIFININYFLFYCVVSDISPPESFKIKQPFSMTFVAMDKNLWRKSDLPLKRPNFAILVF